MFRATAVLLALAPLALARVPVVLDTDIGQDFDDTWSMMYLLSRPDLFDVQLIVSATKNTTGRAALVGKLLTVLNRTDIPIAVGVETAYEGELAGVGPQYPWCADYDLHSYPGTVYWDGVGAMRAALKKGTPSAPVFLVEIAPTPNLGAVLALDPTVAQGVSVFAMSGSVHVGYNGSPPPSAEYNVAQNISGGQAMYAASWARPMVTAPLDTSEFLQILGSNYATFYAAAKQGFDAYPLASVLLENYQVWYDNGGKQHGSVYPFSPSTASSPNYDLQASFMLGEVVKAGGWPSGAGLPFIPYMTFEADRLFVNATGFTVIGPAPTPVSLPAVSWIGGPLNGTSHLSADAVAAILSAHA